MTDIAVRDAETLSTSEPLAQAPRLSELLAVEADRYQTQAEVGHGGGGRLLRAWDRRLERVVAIKVLRKLSDEQEARFRREVLVTARLQHPGIVPVHEIGRWSTGEPYYAMKLVSGESLREVLERRPALRDRLPIVANLLVVAETVAYAHSQQIIHRDLTPANIMLGAFGETVVVDWGLAKSLRDGDSKAPVDEARIENATLSGAVMGTPAYMAPEQALARPVDTRTDVYALGAVLYRVLAGRAPFGPGASNEIVRAVGLGAPPPLAPLATEAPIELIAIADKAMARAPENRYVDAAAFALDLKRFLDGQLVDAHRYTLWQLLRRFIARHRSIVALATVSATALALAGVYGVRRVIGERGRAEQARAAAETSRAAADTSREAAEARTNDLLLAQARLLVDKRPTEALAYLKSYSVSPHPDWPAVWGIAADARSKIVAHHVFRSLRHSRMASDARHVVGIDDKGRLLLVDLATTDATVLRANGPEIAQLAMAKDVVIALGANGALWRWDLPATTPRELVASSTGTLIKLGDNGRYVALFEKGGAVEVFDPSGTRIVLGGDLAETRDLQFSPDGKLVASTGEDLATHMWSLPDGRPRAPLPLRGRGLAFSRDSSTIAVAGSDSLVYVIDVATGKRRSLAGHKDRVTRVAFSPDGKTLYSSSIDTDVRRWDLATGTSRVLKGHRLEVETLAVSLDGRFLASASADQTIRVWDLELGESRELLGHDDYIGEMAFTPDSRGLGSIDLSGQARLWDLPAPPRLTPTGGGVIAFAVSREGTVWAMSPDHLRVLNSDGSERARLDTPGIGGRVQASADGRFAATAGRDGAALLFTAGKPTPVVLRGHRGDVNVLAFTRDGTVLATGGDDHLIRLWNTADATLIKTLDGGSKAIWVLEFSPDGRRLFSAGDEPVGRLWDLDHATARTLPAVDMVYTASFSDDSRLLTWSAGDSTVRLMTLADGNIQTFDGHRAVTRCTALSPDGTVLATGSDDQTVRVCTLRDQHCIVLVDDGPVHELNFSIDGTRLITDNDSHAVRVWDVATGAELLVAHGEPHVVETVLSADAKHAFVSFTGEPFARVWAIDASRPEASPGWLDQLSSVALATDGTITSPLHIR